MTPRPNASVTSCRGGGETPPGTAPSYVVPTALDGVLPALVLARSCVSLIPGRALILPGCVRKPGTREICTPELAAGASRVPPTVALRSAKQADRAEYHPCGQGQHDRPDEEHEQAGSDIGPDNTRGEYPRAQTQKNPQQ